MKTDAERVHVFWNIFNNDQEIRLAIRVADTPECRWFCAWLDDVGYPAQRAGKRAWAPAPEDKLVELLEKVITAARGVIARTPVYWQPGPAQLMLPGERPTTPPRKRERHRTPRRRRRGEPEA
jgi:hypothetical protein